MLKDFLICLLATLNLQLFSFLAFNQSALAEVMNYQGEVEVNVEALVQTIQNTLLEEQKVSAGELLRFQADKKAVIYVDDVVQELGTPYLSIPRLGLVVPVSFLKDASVDELHEDLKRGLVSAESFPAWQDHQQAILYGHSSDYPWEENPYDSVFALLPKLQEGDRFQLVSGAQTYWYEVQMSKITSPQLEGIRENAADGQLVLTTCYPLGFNSQRYNVIAQRL